MPRSVDPSRDCPECARLSHISRWGPGRVNWVVLLTVGCGLGFALLSWAVDCVPFLRTNTAKLPPPVRVGHYLAQGGFFGVTMSWYLRARLHAKHTGEPPNWVSVFWPRILVAIGLFVGVLLLLELLG